MKLTGAPAAPGAQQPPQTAAPCQKTPLSPCQSMPCPSEANSNFSRHLPIVLSLFPPSPSALKLTQFVFLSLEDLWGRQ